MAEPVKKDRASEPDEKAGDMAGIFQVGCLNSALGDEKKMRTFTMEKQKDIINLREKLHAPAVKLKKI